MVLNDKELRSWAFDGGVEPFNDLLVNPASMDLRLFHELREPHPIWQTLNQDATTHLWQLGLLNKIPKWGDPVTFDEYLLHPKRFILCSSIEFIRMPDDIVAILFSKSSAGRIGLEHLHAGFGDPGWHDSQWTWELHNVSEWPIVLKAGHRIMQQVLLRMTEAPERTYAQTGRYNGDSGPTPAKPLQ